MARLVINTKALKGVSSLLTLYKGYWELYNESEEYSKKLIVVNYKLSLTPSEKLWDDLTFNPPTNLQGQMAQVEM